VEEKAAKGALADHGPDYEYREPSRRCLEQADAGMQACVGVVSASSEALSILTKKGGNYKDDRSSGKKTLVLAICNPKSNSDCLLSYRQQMAGTSD
jgi:hypothetical protein